MCALCSGRFHLLGLRADGTVLATGSNTCGQCDVSDWRGVVDVIASDSWSAGVTADGDFLFAGHREYDPIAWLEIDGIEGAGEWTDLRMLSMGSDGFAALRNDGKLLCFGFDRLTALFWEHPEQPAGRLVSISAGAFNLAGLLENGTVWVMGEDRFGQCGTEDWTDVIQVSAGYGHT